MGPTLAGSKNAINIFSDLKKQSNVLNKTTDSKGQLTEKPLVSLVPESVYEYIDTDSQ